MKYIHLIKSHVPNTGVQHPVAPGKTALLLAVLGLTCLAGALPTSSGADTQRPGRGPDLSYADCESIDVPEGSFVSAQLYASGVQIYRWNGSAWVFIAPEAILSADPCYESEVGVHYAGPTWETADGGKVIAARQASCTPIRGAIPWLLLRVTSAPQTGRFAGVAYIQRVHTVGGTAPAEAGTFIGDEARVPYTAEYYFYREGTPDGVRTFTPAP